MQRWSRGMRSARWQLMVPWVQQRRAAAWRWPTHMPSQHPTSCSWRPGCRCACYLRCKRYAEHTCTLQQCLVHCMALAHAHALAAAHQLQLAPRLQTRLLPTLQEVRLTPCSWNAKVCCCAALAHVHALAASYKLQLAPRLRCAWLTTCLRTVPRPCNQDLDAHHEQSGSCRLCCVSTVLSQVLTAAWPRLHAGRVAV